MKSLRAQLILSHVLPQLILLPLLALSLIYIIESRILLADLASDFRQIAALAAQDAAAQPAIWQDAGQAQTFTREFSQSRQLELILIRPDGSVQAALPESEETAQLSTEELSALLAGESVVRSRYSLALEDVHVEALTPVLDADLAVIGIVRITDRLGDVYANLRSIRNIEITATLLAMLVAVLVGVWLARRMDRRLQAVIVAVEQVASADAVIPADRIDTGAHTGAPLHAGPDPRPAPTLPSETVGADLRVGPALPTEFARVFAAVSALSERLRTAEAERKRLLANLVHEVARPIGALQAAVHALQGGAVGDPALRDSLLQGMDEQIGRLKPLLDNLASLYILSGRPVELEREAVNLREWLPGILAAWGPAAEAGRLVLVCDLPTDLPPVSIDPNRMAQVINNLLGNAIKYTPSGGQVRVSAGSRDGQVFIAVEDTGIGIPPEERDKVFEPFYRSASARRFPQGMGLGLSIAADIVRLHGGALQLESEAGKGSCFRVVLPNVTNIT